MKKTKNALRILVAILFGFILSHNYCAQAQTSNTALEFLEEVEPYIPPSEVSSAIDYAGWYWEEVIKKLFIQKQDSLGEEFNALDLEHEIKLDFAPFYKAEREIKILKLPILLFRKDISGNPCFNLRYYLLFPGYIVGDEDFYILDKGANGTFEEMRIPKVVLNELNLSLKFPETGILEVTEKSSEEQKNFMAQVGFALTMKLWGQKLPKVLREYVELKVGKEKSEVFW